MKKKSVISALKISIVAAALRSTPALAVIPILMTPFPVTELPWMVSTYAGHRDDVDGPAEFASFNAPKSVAMDSSGNVYIADTSNNTIRKLDSSGTVTTFAGSGEFAFADGEGTAAKFYTPSSIAVDSLGNVYVADSQNHRVRKITPSGTVTTLAGNGTNSSTDGTGTGAAINNPKGLCVDSLDNIYVTDASHKIRKITTSGVVTTIAGTGTSGSVDGTGTAASFNAPVGLAIDSSGNIFVADTTNHKIRKIDSLGVVTTVAGTGVAGNVNGNGTGASFRSPQGIAIGSDGSLYIADTGNHRIRKITSTGEVTTVAGAAAGSANGVGVAATFYYPSGMAMDSSGNLYVADTFNSRIRKVDSAAVVTTLTGYPQLGTLDGPVSQALLWAPSGLAMDSAGNIYFADDSAHKIRKISPTGTVTTIAGSGVSGFANGTGTAARFSFPKGVAVDSAGNIYVADSGNQRIRKIDPAGVVTTLAGSSDYDGGGIDGTGAAATLYNPRGIAVDSAGNLYVADYGNYKIRKITPAGVVTTLAGTGTSGSTDGAGTSAKFNNPTGVAVDSTGNVYVADFGNDKIRKITPAGVVSTFAGGSSSGTADGTGTSARFSGPFHIAVDAADNLYVTDESGKRIRKITPGRVVTTLAAAHGSTYSSGDKDGVAAGATFSYPQGIAVDSLGTMIYVSDNYLIRKISK